MNDRYLYRAKSIDNGEFVYGNLVISPDLNYRYKAIIIPAHNSEMFIRGRKKVELGFEKWEKVNQLTICQCTGIKDKNGNLIFENDILSAHLDEKYPEDITYAKVIWWKNGFYTKEKGSNDMHEIDAFTEQNYEVVGNIFDDLELLEEGE